MYVEKCDFGRLCDVLAEIDIDHRATVGGVSIRSGMHPVGGRTTTLQGVIEVDYAVVSEFALPNTPPVRFIDEEEAADLSLVI